MQQVEYQRNINHNYLAIDAEGQDEDSVLMLIKNPIKSFLPLEIRICEGVTKYYYEISSLQSMKSFYEYKMVSAEQLRSLFEGVTFALSQVENYLLDENYINLSPEYIYIDAETMELHFLYYPEQDGNILNSLRSFAEYLLEKIDHQQEDAVALGYQFYKLVQNDNFVIRELDTLLEEKGKECNSEDRKRAVEREKESWQEKEKKDEAKLWQEPDKKNVAKPWQEPDKKNAAKPWQEPDKKNETNSWKVNFRKESQKFGEVDEDVQFKGKNTQTKRNNSSWAEIENKNADEDKNEDEEDNKSRRKNIFLSGLIGFILFGIMIYFYTGNKLHLSNSKKTILLSFAIFLLAGSIFLIYKAWKWKAESSDSSAEKSLFFRKKEKQDSYVDDMSQDGEEGYSNFSMSSENKNTNYDFSAASENKEETYDFSNFPNVKTQNPEEYGKTTYFERKSNEPENILIEEKTRRQYHLEDYSDCITIGKLREQVDIVLDDKSVSRIHARLVRENEHYFLEDLNSTNSSFINFLQLDPGEKMQLEKGDVIQIGKVSLIYQ